VHRAAFIDIARRPRGSHQVSFDFTAGGLGKISSLNHLPKSKDEPSGLPEDFINEIREIRDLGIL
jgi:hypothetical protein